MMSSKRNNLRKIEITSPRVPLHYSSTPVLNKVQSLGRQHPQSATKSYSQVLSPQRENDIANWVEQTARFSVSSSTTDISSSADWVDQSRCPSTRNLQLQYEETLMLQSVYKSYRTQNWIGESMVNLYTSPRFGAWTLRYTGVPVLLLDQGESRSRDRGVSFALADRETGLTLWLDKLDNLSSYTDTDTVFHTFHCSADHTVRVGLSWDRPSDALHFLDKVNHVLSSPENIGLSGPKPRAAKRTKVSKSRSWKVSKSEISRPVGFTHNVSLTIDNLADKLATVIC